jgi:hypothetical protein
VKEFEICRQRTPEENVAVAAASIRRAVKHFADEMKRLRGAR